MAIRELKPDEEIEGAPKRGARGIGSDLARANEVFGGGGYRGLLGAASTVVDPIAQAAQLVSLNAPRVLGGQAPSTDPNVLGAQPFSLLEAGRRLGVGVTQPETAGERVLAAAGESVGAATGFLPALQATAATAPGRLGAFAQRFVEPFYANPALVLAEAPVAAAGGATRGALNEAIQPETPLGQFAVDIGGEMLGSLGAYGAGALASRAISGTRSAARSVTTPFREQAAREASEAQARTTIQRAVPRKLLDPLATTPTERAITAIEQSRNLTREIPGLQPNTVDVTGDVGLRSLEGDLARNDPEFYDLLAQRRARNIEAVDQQIGRLAPDSAGPEKVATFAQQSVGERIAQLESAVADARTNLLAQADVGASIDASTRARTTLDDVASDFRRQSRALFDAVDPDGTLRIPTDDLRSEVAAIVQSVGRVEQGDVPRVLHEVLQFAPTEPFSELQALQRKLAAEARAAAEDPARANQGRLLSQARDALEQVLDDVAADPNGGESIQRLRDARRFFREGAQVLRNGTVGDALHPGRRGASPTETLARFIRPDARGGRESLGELTAVGARLRQLAASANPEVSQRAIAQANAIDAEVGEYVVRRAIESSIDPATREISPARLARFREQHGEVLRAFPDAARRIGSALSAREQLDAAEAALTAGRAEVARSALSLFTGQLTPQEAVQRAIRGADGPARIRELRRALQGDGVALEGLRRGVWDEMIDQSVRETLDSDGALSSAISPRVMSKWIGAHEDVLREIYSPQEVARLKRLVSIGERVSRPLPSASRPRIGEALARTEAPGTSAEVLWRLMRARGNVASIGAGFAFRWMQNLLERVPSVSAQHLLMESMLDPEMARRMLQAPTAEGMESAARRYFMLNPRTLEAGTGGIGALLRGVSADTRRESRQEPTR